MSTPSNITYTQLFAKLVCCNYIGIPNKIATSFDTIDQSTVWVSYFH